MIIINNSNDSDSNNNININTNTDTNNMHNNILMNCLILTITNRIIITTIIRRRI